MGDGIGDDETAQEGFGLGQLANPKKGLFTSKSREIYDWFTGRVGDHLPNEHYQRLLPELMEILKDD